MGNVSDILRAARAKIEKPEAWTKGAMARNRQGVGVSASSRMACEWCSFGALMAVTFLWPYDDFLRAQDTLLDVIGYSISPWNDNPDRTHAEVLAAFDAAIAKAESAP